MDIEQARYNMIEQQIRPWEVLDPDVLELLLKVKREEFVPVPYRSLAFVDMEIPLGHGEQMWSPKLEARCLQELQLKRTDTVLEVGTGSGYFTALLASLAGHVRSVDCVAEFVAEASRKFVGQGFGNISQETGDGACGWPSQGPYDAIVMTGSLPLLPEALPKQLKPGGRLFVILGEGPIMQATLITCVAPGSYRRTVLFETLVKALQHAAQPDRFVF
ncbi:MAG TPA: protein-L-isoaspartate O-methyltransferase [Thiobacillaceae bacterium]|nr:protein-L-isoaspartate O-methyltransferase [Thiobacillaceae bacterium]